MRCSGPERGAEAIPAGNILESVKPFLRVLFVANPVLRRFSDESPLEGAAALGSAAWLVAHMLAMVAFIFTCFGLLALHLRLQRTPAERRSFGALIVGWMGIGLALLFYRGKRSACTQLGNERSPISLRTRQHGSRGPLGSRPGDVLNRSGVARSRRNHRGRDGLEEWRAGRMEWHPFRAPLCAVHSAVLRFAATPRRTTA
jgi:hypothetical protein